ncbi:Required for meiotic nuclear division protein 1 [Bulinus truncatus]|nr:Required for meiotic nuclear division protein 1 [Bulinus truncatus]
MERNMLRMVQDVFKCYVSRLSSSIKPQGQTIGLSNQLTKSPTTNCFLSNERLCSTSAQQFKNLTNHWLFITGQWHVNRFSTSSCIRQNVSLRTYNYSQTYQYSTDTSSSTILQDQSALQVRRLARKKAPKVHEENETTQVDNVVAYAFAEQVNLLDLKNYLVKQGLYTIEKLPSDVTNALHVRGKYNVDQKPKEIFVFEDGSVVFWCIPEVERSAFLKVLNKFAEGPYISSLVIYEREELDFVYVKDKTRLNGDTIQIQDTDEEGHKKFLEMYSFSNALAQSVKLAMWEGSLNKFVVSIERIIEDLRKGNKIGMSRRQIRMKIGELFSLRHVINLSSDLLDTPDFYWDRESLEPLYRSLYFYLSISKRTRPIVQLP